MAAVGGHLRSQQIHIFMYLDDWLVKNQIQELFLHQLNQTIQLLVDLGLIINCRRAWLEIGNELPVHKTSDTSCEVETWEFVGMHLADLRWTPTPPHGGLE
jgi:hypothetical protein